MNVLRAQHLGMCFGVRDAIALAQQEALQGPITILGELVHNQFVLNDLKARGVQIAARAEQSNSSRAMITAHGASEKSKAHAGSLGLKLIDATCPLVHSAHAALKRLVRAGLHPVIIGKRDHVEVRGMTDDLESFEVILSVEDVQKLEEKPGFGIVAQTTQPIERVQKLVELVREEFPRSRVEFIDTVCRPTKQRQQAAIELARRCTIVIVIGGANSNNTRELVATCQKECPRAYHVEGANDLCSEWFQIDDVIGITAGTSTPDVLIDSVESRVYEIEQSLCELAQSR